jgi:hypothetical protein
MNKTSKELLKNLIFIKYLKIYIAKNIIIEDNNILGVCENREKEYKDLTFLYENKKTITSEKTVVIAAPTIP